MRHLHHSETEHVNLLMLSRDDVICVGDLFFGVRGRKLFENIDQMWSHVTRIILGCIGRHAKYAQIHSATHIFSVEIQS